MAADDVETLRLLCMGDNHGDVDSLERVVDGTEGEEFDFVIHVGDITNAWFDGVDEGREQLDAVTRISRRSTSAENFSTSGE